LSDEDRKQFTRPSYDAGITTREPDPLLEPLLAFYTNTLATYGPTPPGVSWNSADAQQIRFAKLCNVMDAGRERSIIDYGCGYGALLSYLRGAGRDVDYWGYDICAPMIDAAKAGFDGEPRAHFTMERAELPKADYCVASGIFNVKLDADDEAWHQYMLAAIEDMASLATRGIAFNALTTYSDREKQRPDLHYADPLQLFDYCKRNLSEDVALLHDYKLYDFTIIVRLATSSGR
jgi:SAM-dependent methyltransferase